MIGALWVASGLALAAPQFPALSGRVVDTANLLSSGTEAQLDQLSSALEAKTGSQLVVVTVPDLQGYPIEDFGYQLGRAWGIGEKGEDDGLMLIVAKEERKVRVEVGYGLEGVVTDALSSVIIQRQIVPKFKGGDFDGGVLAGAEALADQVGADPERQKAALKAASKPQVGIPPQVILFLLVVGFIILSNLPRTRNGRRYRGGGGWGGPPVIVWGGGGGGGWGGGGGGGGGFSGGGGSFGGGGASGSW